MSGFHLEADFQWAKVAMGELTPEERAELIGHLRVCEECRNRLQDSRRALRLLQGLPRAAPVQDAVFMPQAPESGWPRLPVDLEARLLALPNPPPPPERLPATPPRPPLSKLGDLLSRVSDYLRAWIAQPAAVAALAVALLVVIFIPRLEHTTVRGPADDAHRQQALRALRLELIERLPDGSTRLARTASTSGGRQAVILEGDPLLLPVLMTTEANLSQNPWQVTLVALEPGQTPKVLAESREPLSIRRLSGTASGYSVPLPFTVQGTKTKTSRLFVLLTSEPLKQGTLERASRELEDPLAPAQSLLGTRPLSGLKGFEATILVEVR